MARTIVALAAIAFAGMMGGCNRTAPVNGVAGFELGKTLLGSVAAKHVCGNQAEQTRCHAGSLSLGGRQAVVELWFDGKSTDTPLAEILLDVPGCRMASIEGELLEKVGKPSKKTDKAIFWTEQYVFIAAREVAPARCEVVFVPPQDQARIARLRG